MVAEFTPEEKELLEGKSGHVAKKHGCSSVYVRLIIAGEREINSSLSKKIHQDLKTLIEFFTPQDQNL